MKKSLIFFMTAAFAIGFAACSDDDAIADSSNEEYTQEVDGPEAMKGFFYETDSLGEDYLVMGVRLDAADTTELSIGVPDEDAAFCQFYAMASLVDSTCLVQNVDGSYTLTLNDELGRKQGTAHYVAEVSEEVLATISFEPDDLVPGVSQVKFINETMWPDNETVTNHVKGNVVYVTAPVAAELVAGSGAKYLSRYTKTVPMVCVNTAAKGNPAYYVYFDTDGFAPEINDDLGGEDWDRVEKYVASASLVKSFGYDVLAYRGGITDSKVYRTNYINTVRLLSANGVKWTPNKRYYTSDCSWFGNHTAFSFSEYGYTVLLFDGEEDEQYPYIMMKRVAYNEAWNGKF
ncbi:MAG: hypothetical protein Q4D56_08130 [Bacteroides sp.]|nr:hypothetical protein [Bacteroides sp.]